VTSSYEPRSSLDMASRDDFNRTGFAFLMTDLELALTMTDIAMRADRNPEKRARNTQNARHAYNTVLRLRRLVVFSDREQEQYVTQLSYLKSALIQLGEKI
jgi:hypothetical protein